jgi:hypothetical protein
MSVPKIPLDQALFLRAPPNARREWCADTRGAHHADSLADHMPLPVENTARIDVLQGSQAQEDRRCHGSLEAARQHFRKRSGFHLDLSISHSWQCRCGAYKERCSARVATTQMIPGPTDNNADFGAASSIEGHYGEVGASFPGWSGLLFFRPSASSADLSPTKCSLTRSVPASFGRGESWGSE